MNISRILMFAALVGAIPTFANSNIRETNSNSERNALQGFSIGFDVVCNHTSVNHNFIDSGQVVIISNQEILQHSPASELYKPKHNRFSLDPSFNVGYSHIFKNNVYAGLFADVSFGRSNKHYVDMKAAEGYSKIKGTSFGLKLKTGYYFQNINYVVYGIFGLKQRGAEFSFNKKNADPRFIPDYQTKAKTNTPLFVVGLGMERPINKKLTWSAEYEYAWKNSTKEARDYHKFSNNTAKHFTYIRMKQKVRVHSFKLGFKYHI